jgi:DNA-binding beta-propeller fold protein YncE
MSFSKKLPKIFLYTFAILFFLSLAGSVFGQVSLRGLGFRGPASGGTGGGRREPLSPGYVFRGEVIMGDKESGTFKNPEDLFIGKDGYIFVADTGNNRILKFDPKGQFVYSLTGDRDGREKLNRPSGLFVNEDGEIYVADTENHRVLRLKPDGALIKSYDKPDFVQEAYFYRPGKVVVDKRDYLYVVNSSHAGDDLFAFNEGGRFLGYFVKNGRRPTDIYTPANITLDGEGFIYLSQIGSEFSRQVKKFDYQGGYVMSFYGSGDRVFFNDLAVDSLGNLFAADTQSRKVYKFDRRGRLIFTFGGSGNRGGLFGSPSALGIGPEGKLYILDSENNNIQVFHPTQFSMLVDLANDALINEDYERAIELWIEVIKLNNFFDAARVGLGEAYLGQGRLLAAMAEFAFVKDTYRLSGTLRKYRNDYFLNHRTEIALWVLGGAVFIPLLIVAIRRLPPSWKNKRVFPANVLRLALGVLTRPVRSFERMASEGGFLSGAVMILLFSLSRYLSQVLTNPLFRRSEADLGLFWAEAALFFVLWAAWSIASFGVGEVFNGVARFKEIAASSAYCLAPYIALSPIIAFLSNFLVLEERMYYDWGVYLLYVWVGLLFFLQTKTLQNFSAAKSAYALALSLGGLVIVLGGVFLVYGINNQMIGFVREIITEVANKTL